MDFSAAPERLLRRMVEVVEEARRDTSSEIPPRRLLDGLAELIPGIGCCFCELDIPTRRELRFDVSSTSDFVDLDVGDLYFRLRHQHPNCGHQEKTGLFDVVQFSDFVTPWQLHQTEIYQEWFKAVGYEHCLCVALPTAPRRTRVIQFFRGRGQPFTETERLMLQLLQPHLFEIYKAAQRRQRTPAPLTARQLDVLRCIANGMDTNEAARHLQLSAKTVDKHLENIYRRLGVSSRMAAVARAFNGTDPDL